ncbi:prepilin-type N-terminal cleavage/methylation domain-containing protein [Cellvibrio sp. KY-YJ-3]|nr:prepilin-type N-terminal cleavage/methylation domain-containing protein [Cellvibrio sp. KY-YJ-3]
MMKILRPLNIQRGFSVSSMPKLQKGFSLVELMISITLGLILMGGVIQMFISSKTAFNTQRGVSNVQESGRLAIEFMARDIRMAGFMGCASRKIGQVDSTVKGTDFQYDMLDSSATPGVLVLDAIRGYSATPAGLVLSPAPLANTDLFVVTGAMDDDVSVIKDKEAATMFASLTKQEAKGCPNGTDDRLSGICPGDVLLVTDCKKARIFQATKVGVSSGELHINHEASGTPGNTISSWGGSSGADNSYTDGGQILKMQRVIYYLAKGKSGRPSLWQNTGGISLEILEGVEDMHITYGRDTNNDLIPDTYNSAAQVDAIGAAAWHNVSSVRLHLLVQSLDDNVVPEKQTYSFADDIDKEAADFRLRQVFVSTVGIRSRLN